MVWCRQGLFGFGMRLVFGCSYGFRLWLRVFDGCLLVISIQVCVRFLFTLMIAGAVGFYEFGGLLWFYVCALCRWLRCCFVGVVGGCF